MRLGFAGIIAVGFLALEMVGIYLVGAEIGLGRTLLWLVCAVLLGLTVIHREGQAFLPRLHQAMNAGGAPFATLWHSGRRLMAGGLFIFPGLISDLIAVLLLLWPAPPAPPTPRPRDDGVIEGEFRRED